MPAISYGGGGFAGGAAMHGGGTAMHGGGGMGAGGMAVGGGMAGGGAMAGGAMGGVGGAGVGCGGCGCEVEAGPAVMSYVGGGYGDYVQETTYKYVGCGAGEFGMVAPKRINYTCIFIGGGVAVLVLALVLVLLLLPGPTTTTTPLTTALPYNCNSPDNPDMWSLAKKTYCCANAGKGCPKPTTTPAPTPPPPTPPSTPSLPYDCSAGVANWAAGWSDAKKAWCCAHGGQGCTTPKPSEPYDCSAGFNNWQAGWSAGKKAYCCTHAARGCAPVSKMCTLWGDPHVISFDQMDTDKSKAYSFYGDGDFWLVKSSTVSIQARFEGTKYTEGLAATNQIVVGGPFLHGHKIEVGTLDSGILTVDGQKVIAGFPGSYSGAGFSVTYDGQGEVPDVVPEGNEKRVVHMDLPLGVKVTVFQWANYMDVQIEMPKQPGQDGVCGNFNGNQGDDTTQAIMARVGARVRVSETLLSGKALIEWTPQMDKMMQVECAAATRAAGHAKCAQYLGPVGTVVNSCTFDYCFGMNVRARSHAKTYA